ncbi:unnamed protein product [Auanema sp. JU1783]|nr:unnamed protein product [Auanema sp. JU1783]
MSSPQASNITRRFSEPDSRLSFAEATGLDTSFNDPVIESSLALCKFSEAIAQRIEGKAFVRRGALRQKNVHEIK